MLVEFPCGYQTGGIDASRLERSDGGGTAIVSMSESDDGSGSLVRNKNYHAEITASSGRVVVVRRAPYWGPRGAR